MSEPESYEINATPPTGDLGEWMFYAYETVGADHPEFAYLYHLANLHGIDCQVETDSAVFWDHVCRVAFTNDHEAWVRGRAA